MIMDRSTMKTIGFSVTRQDGDSSLEIDTVEAVNTEDTLGDLENI
jgi:hypothetical protein